jgi:hypothetical protein
MWTYTTLKQSIQDYVESDQTTFVAELDNIIKLAEDRVLKNAQLPNFRKNSAGTTTAANKFLSIPSDWLATYSLALVVSGSHKYLLPKMVSFIRAAYPNAATTGVPRYYANFEDTYFLLGPTPTDAYPAELHYFYRPESIVDGGTSWLGTHAPACLLHGCLVEAYTFLKGDADLLQTYQGQFEKSVRELKLIGEGFNRTDEARSG